MVLASLTVNGIHAAVRRGMPAWLASRRMDVHYADPGAAADARWITVDRAATYAERISDNALVVAGYVSPVPGP